MKLMYGTGYNTQGIHKARLGNNFNKTYYVWKNMIQRCYCHETQIKHPTYKDCTVCPEWHDYQVFAEWYTNHEYYGLGYQLDKDLLNQGNKIYSPDTCCLVPKELNILLNDSAKARGEYPQGVSFHKKSGKYCAQININGKRKHIGLFICPDKAYIAYKVAKEHYVKQKANEWRDRIAPEVFDALMSWKL